MGNLGNEIVCMITSNKLKLKVVFCSQTTWKSKHIEICLSKEIQLTRLLKAIDFIYILILLSIFHFIALLIIQEKSIFMCYYSVTWVLQGLHLK